MSEPGDTTRTPPGPDIVALYETRLKPRLDALESGRLQVRRLLTKAALLVGAPLLLFVASVILGSIIGGLVGFVLLAVGLFVVVSKYALPASAAYLNYRARFKREVVAEVFSLVCPGATYYPDRRITTEVFEQSGIFEPRGEVKGDDLVRGRIGQTPFEASEIARSYAEDQKTSLVFHGLFFHFDFNRAVRGKTIVQRHDVEDWRLGPRDGLELVRMEHPGFSGRFAVFADDPVEAREMLTPALLERILAIDQATGYPVCLSFAGNRVFVAVHYGRALFEPGMASTTSPQAIAEMAEHFRLAELIVRELGLETRIGTKAVDLGLLDAEAEVDPLERDLSDGQLTEARMTQWAMQESQSPHYETEDRGAAPMRPMDSRVSVFESAGSLTIRYPMSVWRLVWLLPMMGVTLAAAAIGAVAAGMALDPDRTRQWLVPMLARIELTWRAPQNLEDLGRRLKWVRLFWNGRNEVERRSLDPP